MTLQLTGVFTFFENKTYDRRMIFASKYKTACDDIYFIIVQVGTDGTKAGELFLVSADTPPLQSSAAGIVMFLPATAAAPGCALIKPTECILF